VKTGATPGRTLVSPEAICCSLRGGVEHRGAERGSGPASWLRSRQWRGDHQKQPTERYQLEKLFGGQARAWSEWSLIEVTAPAPVLRHQCHFNFTRRELNRQNT